MDSLEHCVNPDMPWRPYIAFLIMYLGVPWVWLVGCVLPLVAVAGMMLAVISSVVGVQAIFPCVVVGVFAIGIHCVGRIWGVWTTETYWTRMSRFRRKLCGSTSSVMDKLPKLSESQKPTLRVSNGMEPLPYMIRFVRKAWMFLFECTVLTGFTYILSSRFPQTARALHALTAPEAGNWSYWTYKNCTKCCYNYATGMGDITAMLSYWIDLGYPRWNTDSATLLDLFNSTFSPAVNRLFLAWTGSILVTVALPYILIGIFVLCALYNMLVGGCTSMFTGWSTTATNVSKSEPPMGQWKVSKDMQLCKDQRKTPGDFCVCALWAEIQRLLLSALSRMCFWLFTVLPLVECFCPERYQLVVVLLLLSCYTVWLYGGLIHFLYRSHRSWLKCSRT
ncbi:uncharacterized protein LOC129592277 [Paramacrobiotus metropolitanus]|uniref:uncharacterized protein LOC129592277 n=1 Tax=Paramacrobiotus metropolitanus TaxID=2943436 RepID=UPI002445A6E5|nr:uncharacterized protein LOC129592277 [Paramacrobiotus metropolitanus]